MGKNGISVWERIILVEKVSHNFINMLLSLFNEEKLYFRHKCIHGKVDGELYVTNLRYLWLPIANGQLAFEYIWNNINKVKYSPLNDPKGRSAMNLELLIPSSTGSTYFELTGLSKDACRFQLEKVKSIISSIKKGEISGLEEIATFEKEKNISSSNGESKPLPTLPVLPSSSSSSSSSNHYITEAKRKQLLESHAFIRNQYNDLVVNSKLLDENDFWSTYGPQYQSIEIDHKQNKGKLPSYFSDSIKIIDDEWKNVSEAKKKIIFKVYPAIQQAYDRKEEFNVSEEDFWRRYAYSFKHDSDGIDELFLRGLLETEDSGVVKLNIDSMRRKKGIIDVIDPEVNLFNIHDDYYKHSMDDTEREYADSILKEGDKVRAKRMLTGGWNEYNQQSKLLLDSSSLLSAKIRRNQFDDDQIEELQELEDNNRLQYMKLSILKDSYSSHRDAGVTESHREKNNNEDENSKEEHNDEEENSAFGKAKTFVSKNFRKTDRIADTKVLSTDHILSSLSTVFPTNTQAIAYHKKEIIDLHSLTPSATLAASHTGNLSSTDIAIHGADGIYTHSHQNGSINSNYKADGHELSDEFKQEMGEVFVSVTERMRHFYILLNRDGTQAPTPGSVGEKKIVGIMNDLIRIHDQLNSKRRKVQSTVQSGWLFIFHGIDYDL